MMLKSVKPVTKVPKWSKMIKKDNSKYSNIVKNSQKCSKMLKYSNIKFENVCKPLIRSNWSKMSSIGIQYKNLRKCKKLLIVKCVKNGLKMSENIQKFVKLVKFTTKI